MTRRGRPPRELGRTIRQVDELLQSEPGISAAQIAFRLGLRKETAQLIKAGLERGERRFPYSQDAA